MRIPVAAPYIGEEEKKFVMQALERGDISGTFGEFVPRFEKEFSAYVGAAHGVTVANGTVALHLALATLGIGAGDEVLVATFTNMASVFAIAYTGAKAVAVDMEADTWNMDPALLEAKITPRTKAIMPVHVYGHPVDMDPVLAIAKKHGLFVVEDAAEAHGAEYKGKRVGALGDIGCFSFYANKIITTGEGGMVVTNNPEYAERAKMLGTLAYGPASERFMHQAVGFNYRMPNYVAAMGCAQMQKVDKVVEMKRAMAARYGKLLGDLGEVLQLPVEKDYAKNVYWMYNVVLRGKAKGRRTEIKDALKADGIETRDAFKPMNRQRIFIQQGLVNKDECPVANNVDDNGFYLPSGPTLTEEEQEYVMQSLRKVL